MKTYNTVFLVLGSVILSASAHASALNYVFNRGAISPENVSGWFCQIAEDGVVKKPLGKSPYINVKEGDVRNPLIFSAQIPNQAVLDSLVEEASNHVVVNDGIGPIGGCNEMYTAITDNKIRLVLLRKSGGVVVSHNVSSAAKKIEKFIDANCGN